MPGDNNRRNRQNDPDSRELQYYVNQLSLIIKPVIACILLSIAWVKISLSENSDFRPAGAWSVYEEPGGSGGGIDRLGGSLANAMIILAQIIGATILFVVLFRYGCWKILYGFLFLVVLMLLGLMGYLLLLNLIQVFSIPLDYITMVILLWNFAAVGLVSIFWRGPMWLQQSYLVVLSSLMAFALTGLQEWTTWTLLAILAVWDLIAVLCPFGPLKMLVESSREQNRDVPALLYSVNMVWLMAHGSYDDRKQDNQEYLEKRYRELQDRRQRENQKEEFDEEDEEETGLKLGLGDFVFYSVLIARTSMISGWVTTIACFVAVLTGLTMTIFLLAIAKKALPALPISIALGLLFYFVSSIAVVPYVDSANIAGVWIV